jgi:hypothetical protein
VVCSLPELHQHGPAFSAGVYKKPRHIGAAKTLLT